MIGYMEKEIKRLRHHVLVLSETNHQLVKDGTSRAASSIARHCSLSSDDVELEIVLGVEGMLASQKVVGTLVGEKARRKADNKRVPAKRREKGAEEFNAECSTRGKFLGSTSGRWLS